ncbi:MAG: DUF2177 family protein [Verrucomicrobiota bacterium]
MTNPIALYVMTMVIFAAFDAFWLTFVSAPQFKLALGDTMRSDTNWIAAVLFYLMFMGLLVWFAIFPGLTAGSSLSLVALQGALVGLAGYGTYQLTNMATLSAWKWKLVVLDAGWGVALSGFVAALVVWIVRTVTA